MEKFRRRFWSGWIESSLGFAVRTEGRVGLLYREGDRLMNVDSEMLAVDRKYSVDPSSIRQWEAPFDKTPVTEEDRERIFDNIRRALESCGEKVVT